MRFPAAWNRLSKRQKEDEPIVVASPVLQRRNATKRRSVYRTAPPVTERASSLYHRQTELVSDSHTASPASSAASFTHTHSSTYSNYEAHLYHLKENPSLFFPSPPPRASFYNDRRHTDIWDDLFEYAEAHTAYAQPQQTVAYHSTIDLSENKSQKAKSNLFGLKRLAMRSEIWSKSFLSDMDLPVDAAPVIPPRSRLRSNAPIPLTSHSSYQLPVDAPIPESSYRTPPLSAGGSSYSGSPSLMPPSPPNDTIAFGRKKKAATGLGKDPLRVKDGAEPRRASSGVYTPTTFPGAAGPRPSHFPSHVYTPNNFVLHPAPPAGASSYPAHASGPSRSSSFSSAESDSPQTPGSRFSHLSGKALTGLKRISHQLPKVSQAPVISAPLSARDSYFPSTVHETPRVWTPQTPVVSVKSPSHSPYDAQPFSPNGHGLGMGLTEQNGAFVRPDAKPRAVSSVLFDESAAECATAAKTSPQAKGRRKPVPKILDDPVQLTA